MVNHSCMVNILDWTYLENIVYNELVARDYNVNIGNLVNEEIYFIVTKFEKNIYSSSYILSDE